MIFPLVWLVRIYQWTLRPFIGAHCRFEPSCSAYAIIALQRHGAWRGAGLSTRRVLRCNPWNDGGLDPVPDACRCRPHDQKAIFS
ncbi:MAG: membrane protein insertion efficiency factor YidD [Acetobacteraceae bacterium]|nr:membrane protein insertion efficiency factor YidD [Acetobacteraceae bacterium]